MYGLSCAIPTPMPSINRKTATANRLNVSCPLHATELHLVTTKSHRRGMANKGQYLSTIFRFRIVAIRCNDCVSGGSSGAALRAVAANFQSRDDNVESAIALNLPL